MSLSYDKGLSCHFGRLGKTHNFKESGSDVCKAAALSELNALIIVYENKRNGVCGVSGVRLACLVIYHLFSIAVVCADEEHAINVLNSVNSSAYQLVYLLNCLDSSGNNACVTYHIRVSKVDDDNIILVGLDSVNKVNADLGSAHFGLEVIGCDLGGVYEDTSFVNVGSFDAAVEEECYVSIFLGLGKTELLLAVLCQIFAESVLDLFLLECNQLVGDILIVILESYICEGEEAALSFKACELVVAECTGDLSCSVGTEIEENNGIVRLYK